MVQNKVTWASHAGGGGAEQGGAESNLSPFSPVN
jgi:hypothetical protein